MLVLFSSVVSLGPSVDMHSSIEMVFVYVYSIAVKPKLVLQTGMIWR